MKYPWTTQITEVLMRQRWVTTCALTSSQATIAAGTEVAIIDGGYGGFVVRTLAGQTMSSVLSSSLDLLDEALIPVPFERIMPRFYCPTCKESWATHRAAWRHVVEVGCFHDRATKHCLTCPALVKGKEKGDPLVCTAGMPIVKPWKLNAYCPRWGADA